MCENVRETLLISACLMGVRCRYDGGGQAMARLDELMERYVLVPVCPEVLGGLPTPREPAELRGERVVTRTGRDVTDAFRRGAAEAARIARVRLLPRAAQGAQPLLWLRQGVRRHVLRRAARG